MVSIFVRRFMVLGLALATVLVLAVSACGGDDADDDANGDGPTITAEDGGDDDDDDNGNDDATATDTPDGGDDGDDDDGGGDDDDNGNGSGDVPDLCSLLTPTEIEAATGAAVSEGTLEAEFEPFYSCQWSTESFDFVSLELFEGDDDERDFYYELTDDAEEVDGLGEKAQYTDLIGLEIMTDDHLLTVSISVSALTEDETFEASRELAEIALGRLE
jgi:hypothetical protein